MPDQPDSTPPRRVIDDPDFDGGHPLDADLLRRAAGFMSTVRDIQRNSGRKMSGMKRLSEETLEASAHARQGSDLLARLGREPEPVVPSAIQQQVFESFEEVCRRRRVTLPPDLRPAVYRLLGIELTINSHALDATPEQIAPATVHNGSLDQLPNAFPEFRATPGLFRTAAVGYPSDPESFLQSVQGTLSRLERDERFAEFRDTPSIFRTAAVHHPSDPEGFLLRVQETVTRLERDERFAVFRDMPYVFRTAAVGYPSDPESFLQSVQGTLSRLERDERFAEFRDTPGLLRTAAVHFLSDPEGFLLGVQRTVTNMERDERFAEFRDTPSIFRTAAVHHPSDPEGFLLRVQETVTRLERDERFAVFRDMPSIFRTAAVGYPSDPEGFLKRTLADCRSEPREIILRAEQVSPASGPCTSLSP